MIAVVDTSALIQLFTIHADGIDAGLGERLADIVPHVPDIVDVEFHHALRGLLLGAKIGTATR